MYQRKLNTQTPDKYIFRENKIKIITAASLFLLFLIIVIIFFTGKDNGKENSVSKIILLTPELLSHDIDSILSSFGIQKNWVKDIKNTVKESGVSKENLWIAREIIIPADLLTIDINYEFSGYFNVKTLGAKIIEDPQTKNVKMSISQSPDSTFKIIGILNFIYSDSVKRNVSDVCIVLDSIESLTTEEAESILNSAENISVMLPLRNDKAEYQSLIKESDKNYLINVLIGNEDNIIADFKPDMKSMVWKAKVKSLILNFSGASGIIIENKDPSSELSNNIKLEFENNKIKIYPDSMFKELNSENNIVRFLFEDIRTQSVNGKRYLLYRVNLNRSEYEEFESGIYSLKKIGFRFFNFDEFIRRKENAEINKSEK